MNQHGAAPTHTSLSGVSSPGRIAPSLLLKKTLLLSSPFVLIVILAIATYYEQRVSSVESHAGEMNVYASHDLQMSLVAILRNIKGDARLLASNPLLPMALRNPWSADGKLLAQQWQKFSAQKRIYDQMRLLNLDGQEVLRVNLTSDGATIVPRQMLQNKFHRYYFSEAMTLPAGDIYFSPLDLNIENKKIELPLKPMLRISFAVTDSSGNRIGLLILNYLAANILEEINAHSVLSGSQSLFINQQGYYLHGFDREQEWRFMYPLKDQSEGRFGADYPEEWQSVATKPHGQLMSENGIFSFHWVSTSDSDSSENPFTRHFALISMISAEHMEALKAPYLNAALAALILAIPTILIIAAIASLHRLRELDTFRRLRSIEANQRLILESVGEGIFGIDAEGRLTFANTRAADLTGYMQNEMLGRPLHSLIHACNEDHHDHEVTTCPLQQSITHGIALHEENDTFLRKNCESFPVEYISNPIIKNGQLHGGVVSFFDITARKKAEQHIEYLALHDALTHLPNKNLLLDRLGQQLTSARNNGQMATLLYIDIDRFKQINDAMGHAVGDELLIAISQRLISLAEEGDTIARIGSDEFALLCANDEIDAEHMAHLAQLTADEVMLVLEQPFNLEKQKVRVTASIGIAIFPLGEEDPPTILAQADTAVASAKTAGRHTTRFFETKMEQTTKEWLLIHNRMLDALANDAFDLVYQPKVDRHGKLLGVEALLRWRDDELGQVSPSDFIPIAEQSGMMTQISDFVLGRVCRQIKIWSGAGLQKAFNHVAINISPGQFNSGSFVDDIMQHIAKAGIDPHTIELEITERTLVDDVALASDKVLSLRQHGVRFSIDDFGTGYSSLAYLQQLPLDRLKIDRAFVTDVNSNHDRQSIVEAIILLAKGLGIEVIAEGVETEEELNYLLNVGCHEFQGYLFHRPMSPDLLTDLLRQSSTEDSSTTAE